MKRLMVWNPVLSAPDKRTLIDTVAVFLAQHGIVPLERQGELADALMEREDLGGTLIAEHLAIPHATCPYVDEGAFVFVKLAEPIDDWAEGAHVDRFVFTVLHPEPESADGEAVRRFFTDLADDDVLAIYEAGDHTSVTRLFHDNRDNQPQEKGTTTMAQTAPALTLNDVLDRNTILTDVKAETKEDVFRILADRLFEQGYVESADDFVDALHNREKEGATGIGNHITIPHGRSETVKRNGVAIAILDHEIAWESLDDTGAKLVVMFTVGASGDGANDHLKLLSLFARKMAQQQVVDALLQAGDADQVIAAFQD